MTGKANLSLRDTLAPWPRYEADEIEAVAAVLRNGRGNYLHGEEGGRFEREFADWCGAKHGLAVMNGTVGLELALRGVGVGPGDEVIVTARSFVASASAAMFCGATPVFADVDRDSQNLTPHTVKAVLGGKTRAVIAVHLAGWPCDVPGIRAAVGDRVAIIEDCAQAHGAAWNGKRVGAAGDVAVFSFCHDKIMSTGGEGGMVLTGREDVRERMDAWRLHGRDLPREEPGAAPYLYRFVYGRLGSNYRMTEMQSAIGRVQLGKVEGWLAERDANARRYAAAFGRLPGLRVATPPKYARHAWYKYYVFVRPEVLRTGWNRDRILKQAWERGLPCYEGTCSELYREGVFAKGGHVPAAPLPVAQELARTALMFPVHPGLDAGQIDRIGAEFGAVMAEAAQ